LARAAALRVAGRSASGRMAMPLPSKLSTSSSSRRSQIKVCLQQQALQLTTLGHQQFLQVVVRQRPG
jgi:hypothetical protein